MVSDYSSFVVLVMAPTLVPRPKHTCFNYPLCTGSQYRSHKDGQSNYCKRCLDTGATCSFADCTNPCAPGNARIVPPATCALHYKDPAELHGSEWNVCGNMASGCRELAVTPKGRKCFLCAANSLPCLYASYGCTHHVRSPAGTARRAAPPLYYA